MGFYLFLLISDNQLPLLGTTATHQNQLAIVIAGGEFCF